MFEFYNDTLCVHGGWLYKSGLMKKCNYDSYTQRGPFRVLRSGGGKNTPALIAWVSLQPEYQEQIKKEYGDPTKTTKHIIFRDYLERDPKAIQFYADYTLETGEAIQDDLQKKYAAEASILNAINRVLNDRVLKTKALGTGGKLATWKKLAEIIHNLPRHTWPHALPKNYRSLQRKYKSYNEEGYEALIHGGIGHKNSEKINDNAKLWVMARWCDRVRKVATIAQLHDEYNEKAAEEGWKLLKDDKALYNFLNKPDVKSQWYGYRYGELKAKEKYNFQNSTKMPTMRDSLWYSDGTKLNLYYLDENNKMATCNVYEVMDAYSELLLGYHVSATEDYQAQYYAYKMAAKNAGHRPYEIRFDGQGGHKKLVAGEFLSKVARLSIKTQPYNGKSKTIESAFGRFQQQVMKKLWYFTGQNINAKKEESKANMEFILANKSNLPTLEEAIQAYEQCRMEWNQKPHHATKTPKVDMYYASVNPKAPELTMFEMVDIFWILRDKPATLNAYGLTFKEKNQKYTYMVYDENRMPDVDFLNKHIDRKFFVRFDPDDMSLVYLYEKTPMGLRFVSAAETKLETARAIQDQEDWEASYYKKIEQLNKTNRINKRDAMDEILEQHGMLPEQYGLNSPALKGIESQKRKNKANKAAKVEDIGEYQKALSNAVPVDHEDNDIYDMM